ncbi:MAG: CaiB/BaiF CoA-transferase family protein [Nocardioides sp.]
MSGPLDGLVVVEIGRYIAAPYAGRLLADLGADVIKVEEPDGGDPMRRWEGGDRPYSPQFAAYNRSKRSVALDLKDPAGAAALRDLLATADVLLENFRPGVMARLGLDPADLVADNPRLVACSITGFGAEGEYAARPSYDTVISAMGGLYSLLMPIEDPSPVGPGMSDLLSGMFAVQGVLAALHERSTSGRGQVVDVTMLGSVLGFLTEAVTTTIETGEEQLPDTRQRRAQAYGCVDSDGLAFVVHLSVPDKFWHALTDALDHPEWRDDARFADRQGRYTHYVELERLIKDATRTRTRAEWFDRFRERDLPHGPMNTVGQVVDDPQVAAMGLLEDVDIPGGPPMRMTTPAAAFSRTPTAAGRAAPTLGVDTDSVLHADQGGVPHAHTRS